MDNPLPLIITVVIALVMLFSQSGNAATATYYADQFHGRKTSSGEIFSQHKLTAAHRHLPFGTKVKVTNKETGKSVIVKINDRGPFSGHSMIDLSKAAARRIGLTKDTGSCQVKIEVIKHVKN